MRGLVLKLVVCDKGHNPGGLVQVLPSADIHTNLVLPEDNKTHSVTLHRKAHSTCTCVYAWILPETRSGSGLGGGGGVGGGGGGGREGQDHRGGGRATGEGGGGGQGHRGGGGGGGAGPQGRGGAGSQGRVGGGRATGERGGGAGPQGGACHNLLVRSVFRLLHKQSSHTTITYH